MNTTPHPVDTAVGNRIRQFRLARGMTQQELGDVIGVKFQQVQKYETGMNRVSASRLFETAEALNYPIADFFGSTDPASMTAQTVDEALALSAFRHLECHQRGSVLTILGAMTQVAA